MWVSQLEGHKEAMQMESLQSELKRIDFFAKDFAKASRLGHCLVCERGSTFGTVIGLPAGQGSEAFEAFLAVPFASNLEAIRLPRRTRSVFGRRSGAWGLLRSSHPYKQQFKFLTRYIKGHADTLAFSRLATTASSASRLSASGLISLA